MDRVNIVVSKQVLYFSRKHAYIVIITKKGDLSLTTTKNDFISYKTLTCLVKHMQFFDQLNLRECRRVKYLPTNKKQVKLSILYHNLLQIMLLTGTCFYNDNYTNNYSISNKAQLSPQNGNILICYTSEHTPV